MSTCAERALLKPKSDVLGAWSLLAFRRFVQAYELRYSENQPRVPGGQPGAGQFTFGDGDPESSASSSRSREGEIILAGGFEPGDASRKVQEFMSANCRGSIRAEMPGQFLDLTIGQVQDLAKSGDAAARTCIKLLRNNEYRK